MDDILGEGSDDSDSEKKPREEEEPPRRGGARLRPGSPGAPRPPAEERCTAEGSGERWAGRSHVVSVCTIRLGLPGIRDPDGRGGTLEGVLRGQRLPEVSEQALPASQASVYR